MAEKKSPAALIIELAGPKKKEKDQAMEDKIMVAEELMRFVKEDDAEGFAMALYDFIEMCKE